jgi:peptide/nickel transport system substrate-binding protein
MARRPNQQSDSTYDRRSFLKAGGAGAVAVSLAGCLGGDDGGSGNNGSSQGQGGNGTQSGNADMDPEQIPEGGVFTVGLPEAPAGLNTLATSSSYSFAILDFINEFGTAITPKDFDIRPSLYTDWTIENTEGNDPSPTVLFSVRDGAGLTFTDGESFGVDDVVFTYNYMLENQPGRYVSTIDPIESVETASGNDWDVRMEMDRVVGTYDSNQLQIPILPEHVWSNVDNYQQYEPTANGGPVGLGPGEVTEFNPDTAIELTFRDDFDTLNTLDWVKEDDVLAPGGPFLDTLRFQVFGSQNALNQALLQGNIDATYLGLDSPQQIEQVKESQNRSLVSGPDSGFSYQAFNLRRTPLDDVAFRQAYSFAFDDFYWTENLKRGYAVEGDFVMPPGYGKVRPETGTDQELLEGPSTQALTFRAAGPESSEPNVQGIRDFLTSGTVISGDQGTFVGSEYPGAITDVTASQTEARHDYSFGPVQSQVLQQADNANQEIRVNGETITEMRDGPLVLLQDPPQDQPQEAKAIQRLVENLHAVGIPIQTQVLDFNTMLDKVYAQEDFDIYPMGWNSLSSFAVSSLYSLFHSDNADPDGSSDTLLNNAVGYGLEGNAGADQLISQARGEPDSQRRNDLARQAVEKIYLDVPYMLLSYDEVQWPVNTADFDGFIQNLTDPGGYSFATEMSQVHQKQG